MNDALAERIARAVLYEGYILYPYRPSVKNTHRWTFGGLYPPDYCQPGGSDNWQMQAQMLVSGDERSVVEASVRFLQPVQRTVGKIEEPLEAWPSDGHVPYTPVPSLEIEGKEYHTWQEARERRIDLPPMTLGRLIATPAQRRIDLASAQEAEPLRQADGRVAGMLVRRQEAIDASVHLGAEPLESGVFKITMRVSNQTSMPLPGNSPRTRDEAVLRSMVSTHFMAGVSAGQFISSIDPPAHLKAHTGACCNIGLWPVMVGEPGQCDTILCSPIILYDYPQIAEQSPGDLFDSTEIDEILTLRILTLSDEEKKAVAGVDERAAELLNRTQSLAQDQLLALHGAVRGLRPVNDGASP